MNIEIINDQFSVTAQIEVEDLENLQLEGYDSIVCNRPDDEESGQPKALEIKEACDALGLKFLHIPMTAPIYNEKDKVPFNEFLSDCTKTLGYCRTGRRALVLYKGANDL
ncbi:beta-lactamase hydrolase domain-containing protein [Marinicellulosiphila megalodicopiae]|uniref:beta-lactamase hydrolase domain-containing protein n=1 Tax=Marinicellulosiphila megalodicopiae TaxID=2724896 RepID=UPI003BB13294